MIGVVGGIALLLGYSALSVSVSLGMVSMALRQAGITGIPLGRMSVWAAVVATILGVIFALAALATPGYTEPVRPQRVTPSCAQHVDFPDSDPPRYGVCVPAEEAG